MKISVTELPFNNLVGVQLADDPAHLLRLPAGKQYLNHIGTVHASAQLALAEASSGEFLLRHFGSAEGIIPVVRRMDAKFRKPATGSITSSVTVAPETLAQLDAELSTKVVRSFRFRWRFTTSRVHIHFPRRSSGLFSMTKASNQSLQPTADRSDD